MSMTVTVKGMTCQGCAKSLERTAKAAAPGKDVVVEYPKGTLRIAGVDDVAVLQQIVEKAGFEYAGQAA